MLLAHRHRRRSVCRQSIVVVSVIPATRSRQRSRITARLLTRLPRLQAGPLVLREGAAPRAGDGQRADRVRPLPARCVSLPDAPGRAAAAEARHHPRSVRAACSRRVPISSRAQIRLATRRSWVGSGSPAFPQPGSRSGERRLGHIVLASRTAVGASRSCRTSAFGVVAAVLKSMHLLAPGVEARLRETSLLRSLARSRRSVLCPRSRGTGRPHEAWRAPRRLLRAESPRPWLADGTGASDPQPCPLGDSVQ